VSLNPDNDIEPRKSTLLRVGIREFRTHVSALVRHVEETGEAVEITRRGKLVARLVPVPKRVDRQRIEELFARREQLVTELSSGWPKGLSAADAVAEDRRDL
jgi:prevent-host-death family protein